MNRLLLGKKRKVTVLIGNGDDGINDAITHCIAHACRGEYVIAISTLQAEEALKHARGEKFDLCILVLNNIIYTPPHLEMGFDVLLP
jgi:hypothetical protein